MDTYHSNKFFSIVIVIIFIGLMTPIVQATNDSVYPNTVDIPTVYNLNNTNLTIDDTLIVTRIVINNEATPLTSFYFCDNLPTQFEIISHTLTINELAVTYDYPTPIVSSTVSDCNEYYWVLDYPGLHGVYDLEVQPNDTVIVEYKITCQTANTYDLPLHTIIAHNGTTGIFGFTDSMSVRFDVSLSIDDPQFLPYNFSLGQNYPNPFNPSTTIEFSIPTNSYVNLEIYNLLGQSINSLLQQNLPPGNHTISWNGLTNNGNSAASGIYIYKLRTQDRELSKTMLLLK